MEAVTVIGKTPSDGRNVDCGDAVRPRLRRVNAPQLHDRPAHNDSAEMPTATSTRIGHQPC